jgi:hypothetical protein
VRGLGPAKFDAAIRAEGSHGRKVPSLLAEAFAVEAVMMEILVNGNFHGGR